MKGECALLEVDGLSIRIREDGHWTQLTDQVSFKVHSKEIYGLVGESGCGKSITAMATLNLFPDQGQLSSGKVYYKGQDMGQMNDDELCSIRGKEISVIFQEPSAALNPLMRIRQQLEECFYLHQFSCSEGKIQNILKQVGFSDPERVLRSYPHELSGGMLQRVMIAMAILLKPNLIIADEPTTALDVTIQAQIMELLFHLAKEEGISILLITHNLNLIAQYADRIGVMYAGRMVEESDVSSFFRKPLHPYSKGLLGALPSLNTETKGMEAIQGQVPLPMNYASGCRFAPRCSNRSPDCEQKPKMKSPEKGHQVACFHYLGNENENDS